MSAADRTPAGAPGPAWFAGIPAALVLLVYAPVLAGWILYARDITRWVYPVRWFVRDCLERGEPPWWNPDVGLGFPVLADPLYGIFYPPNLLHAVGPLPLMVTLVMLLHLLAGAAGVALLARAFGVRRAAAATAGVAWALSGFVASLWTNGIRLPAAAWMPWQALAFTHLARALAAGRPWQRAAAGAGAGVAGGLLAGDVFVAAMGTGLGLGLAAVWALGERRGAPDPAGASTAPARRFWPRLLAASMAAVAAGAATAMIGILPAARALAGTERAGGMPAAHAELGSLHPARLLEFAVAGAYGKAWEWSPDAPWVKSVLDGRPMSLSVYAGASVLALLLLACRRPPRPAGGAGARAFVHVAGVGVLAALGLLVAMGRHTPLHAAVRALFPPLGYMRTPEKYLLAVVPCVALLAAFGAERLLCGQRPPWRRVAALVAALLTLAMLAPSLFLADLSGFVRAGALHGAVAAAGVGAALHLARRRRRLGAALLLTAVVTADLGLGSSYLMRFGKPAMLTETPPAARAILEDHAGPARPAPRLFRDPKVQESAARAGGSREMRSVETLRDNVGVTFGIAILPGYDAALPPAAAALLARRQTAILRLLAIDYVLLPRRDGADGPAGLEPLGEPLAGVRLFRVASRLPRVFLGFQAERAADDDARARLADDDVAGGRRILLREGAALDGPAGGPVPCVIERFSTTRVDARCSADRAALAVFVEQHAPGWSATVDGVPAPLLVADTLLRAVPVPAGSHRVSLSYKPPGLLAGTAATMLGLCALVGLALYRPSCANAHATPRSGERPSAGC